MSKLKELFLRYKEIILYLFFGGCPTLVNMAAYFVFTKLNMTTAVSTVISWVLSVLFAYVTNRLYVFESKGNGIIHILKEATQFFLFRLATGVFDLVFMVLTVDMLAFNGLLMKILSNVIVIISNYIFSKLFVFKKRNN